MINNEDAIFNLVASKLREKYSHIYITNSQSNDTPPMFPSVLISLDDNPVITRYSEFKNMEKVVEETYRFEVTSNLITGKEKECKDIINTIDEIMSSMYYYRSFNQPIAGIDSTTARRIARYRKFNT